MVPHHLLAAAAHDIIGSVLHQQLSTSHSLVAPAIVIVVVHQQAKRCSAILQHTIARSAAARSSQG